MNTRREFFIAAGFLPWFGSHDRVEHGRDPVSRRAPRIVAAPVSAYSWQ